MTSSVELIPKRISVMFKNGQIMWFGQYHVTCGYDLVVMIAASQAVCPGSNPGARIPQIFL